MSQEIKEGWKFVTLNGEKLRRMITRHSDFKTEKSEIVKGCGELVFWRYYKTDPTPKPDGESNYLVNYPQLTKHDCKNTGYPTSKQLQEQTKEKQEISLQGIFTIMEGMIDYLSDLAKKVQNDLKLIKQFAKQEAEK